MTQFIRDIRLQIEDVEIKKLHINFNIVKTLLPQANESTITIFNLSRDTRDKIKKASFTKGLKSGSPIIFDAGYLDFREQLFVGEVTKFTHMKQGQDWVTALTAQDGFLKLNTTYGNQSFANGSKARQIINYIKTQAAFSDIDISTVEAELNSKIYDKGYVVSGNVFNILDTLANDIVATWSIQDGKLVILKDGKSLSVQAIAVNEKTGLINAPIKTEKGYNFTNLLNTKIKPGVLLNIDSAEFHNLQVIAQKVTYTGSNFGNSYYVQVEGKELA